VELKAFLDESGIHDSSPVVTVGGVMGTEQDWSDLSLRWEELLARHRLPYFHASDFEARQDVFGDLSKADRLTLQLGLIDAVRDTRLWAYVFSVWRGAPDNREGPIGPFLESPYKMTVGACFAEFAIHASGFLIGGAEADHRVAFVCDRQEQWGAGAVEVFRDMQTAEELFFRGGLESLTFGEWRKSPPLQVSDLVVYEVWKDYLNRATTSLPERRSLTRLRSGKMQLLLGHGGKEDFERLAARVWVDEVLIPKGRQRLAELRTEREEAETRRS
jgi:Protein of unknown function (DUF3800)